MNRPLLVLLLLLCAAAIARAQPLALNEIYAAHANTEDQEFIEIVGAPGIPLSNVLVCVVDGDGSDAGILDSVWDLTGHTMPVDGYFVLGVAAVPGVDFVIGTSHQLENGTQTIYLLNAGSAANVAAIHALVGTDISGYAAPGTEIVWTQLEGMGTILDLVGLQDSDLSDLNFNGAPALGPDAGLFPAGIFRSGDFPGTWSQRFLDRDFEDAGTTAPARTPGLANAVVATGGISLGYNGNGLLNLAADTDPGTGQLLLKISGAAPGSPIILFVDVSTALPGVLLPDGSRYIFPSFAPPIALVLAADQQGEYQSLLPAGPFGAFAQAGVVTAGLASGLDVSNVLAF